MAWNQEIQSGLTEGSAQRTLPLRAGGSTGLVPHPFVNSVTVLRWLGLTELWSWDQELQYCWELQGSRKAAARRVIDHQRQNGCDYGNHSKTRVPFSVSICDKWVLGHDVPRSKTGEQQRGYMTIIMRRTRHLMCRTRSHETLHFEEGLCEPLEVQEDTLVRPFRRDLGHCAGVCAMDR